MAKKKRRKKAKRKTKARKVTKRKPAKKRKLAKKRKTAKKRKPAKKRKMAKKRKPAKRKVAKKRKPVKRKTTRKKPVKKQAPQYGDVLVRDQGTIVGVQPVSSRAKSWFEKNVHVESWQRIGSWIYVDHRAAQHLVEGIQRSGLKIKLVR